MSLVCWVVKNVLFSAVNLSTGKACCVGYVSTCVVPVFEKCLDFTCADINKLMADSCPIKKGGEYNMYTAYISRGPKNTINKHDKK